MDYATVFLTCVLLVSVHVQYVHMSVEDDFESLRAEMKSMKSYFTEQLELNRAEIAALRRKLQSRLHTRSDDVDPMSATVSQLAASVQQLQAKVSALETQTAQMATPLVLTLEAQDSKSYNTGDIIKFRQVLERSGITYDSTTGVATVPEAGTYVIYVRVDLPYAADYLWLDLNVNGVVKINAFGEHGSVGGVTYALRLHAGDRVWVSKDARGHTTVDPATMLSIVRVSL